MKKINLIFDCDGTLVDSYPAIVDRIDRVFSSHNIHYDLAKIREYCLYSSVGQCIETISTEHGLNAEQLQDEYKQTKENFALIELYPGILEVLKCERFNCFVYTHRGVSTKELFTGLGIYDLFIEIVTSVNGFKRKPDGEACQYLVDKYSLKKEDTYYVGDRLLDIECGNNAGIKTIFVNSGKIDIDQSKATYIIDGMDEIIRILSESEK